MQSPQAQLIDKNMVDPFPLGDPVLSKRNVTYDNAPVLEGQHRWPDYLSVSQVVECLIAPCEPDATASSRSTAQWSSSHAVQPSLRAVAIPFDRHAPLSLPYLSVSCH